MRDTLSIQNEYHFNMGYTSNIFSFSLIAFIVLMTACSSTGPKFERIVINDSSDPLLYIYRPESDCMESIKIDFLVDDAEVVTLGNNEYGYVYVKTGKNLIISGALEKEEIPLLKILIDTEGAKEYFVQYEIECGSEYMVLQPTFTLRMKQVEGVIARSHISSTNLTAIENQVVYGNN